MPLQHGLNVTRNLRKSLQPRELKPNGWRLPNWHPRPNSYRKGPRFGARKMRRL